jgi:hypothetical protein
MPGGFLRSARKVSVYSGKELPISMILTEELFLVLTG